MIERIIEYSIRNRWVVLAIAAVLTVLAIYAVLDTPMDAIPDLSENQLIIFTDWPGRSPREIEDQITYPLSLKLQGLAGIRTVRSTSEFNFSLITLIFEDGIDYYFARTRVLEKLAEVSGSNLLPPGVTPRLAPDATAVGQIYWYTVEVDPAQPLEAGRLWALNRFYIVPQLSSVSGVAEVAPVGGAPLEYQLHVRPEALRAYGITLDAVVEAVARSNQATGGGVVQKNSAEYVVRGVGWIRDKRDLENTVIQTINGVPIYVRQIATVSLGIQYRRSVFEKDGNEVVGGVVLMRHGENPLAVTRRIQAKIRELQPGLPSGVRILPAYERTRLIHGAIDTLTRVLWHEMFIAALAILLILMHGRSVFVICVTLPLSVLFSFLMLWLLRHLKILDVQANIMSLAGITISIGVLVDQAIVMTENATQRLTEHFGQKPVRGDIIPYVLPACRLVGRPIFFAVLIMLLSFLPVFLLGGREGKYFYPLAVTKSLAMVGVAILSVTVVPALIPIFLKGRLRREQDSPIVRSFIAIYKPFLRWALPRRNLVMWLFAALLLLAAGLFPVQALLGYGASESAWRTCFLGIFALVAGLTVLFIQGWFWQLLALISLISLALVSYSIPPKHRIGVEFMPPLDEGSLMDMPVTVPRVGITQAIDDLKHRNALIRSFPEVESVIGKVGRAETPTDPAPLDMVETFINFRPRQWWPRRVLAFDDAARQTASALQVLENQGFMVRPSHEEDRNELINGATQKALERFDEIQRERASQLYQDWERQLAPQLTHWLVSEAIRRWDHAGRLHWPEGSSPQDFIDRWAAELIPRYGRWLAKHPLYEDVDRLTQELASKVHQQGIGVEPAALLAPINPFQQLPHTALWIAGMTGAMVIVILLVCPWRWWWILGCLTLSGAGIAAVSTGILTREHKQYLVQQGLRLLGYSPPSWTEQLWYDLQAERHRLWDEAVERFNWELFDLGTAAYTWLALEELVHKGAEIGLIGSAPRGAETERFRQAARDAQFGKPVDPRDTYPFGAIRDELMTSFRQWVFFHPRRGGKDGDLIADEMYRVLQVPGWSNIFTMPIINRIDMLSTGIRTQVGVKVFGPDLETVSRISQEVEAALKPIRGASDVIASPIMGKGYVEITLDRSRAARYGITVDDVLSAIETAIGGRIVTSTVEQRDRFPVRIRFARAAREDETRIRQVLVSPGTMPRGSNPDPSTPSATQPNPSLSPPISPAGGPDVHAIKPPHAVRRDLLIPLGAVADIRIVDGPAVIKSENGRLVNTVTLNVRQRDLLGFVEEAQRIIAQKVPLPEGVTLVWSGEFEHQLRAAQTLRLVLPLVLLLIVFILYLTYRDVADAALMLLTVPEALAGGVFFLWLFPKILHGWETPPLDFTIAVWVGFIACFGMAAETGIIMLVYLREAIHQRGGLEKISSLEELQQAVIEGAAHRLRPKLLTEGVAIVAIFPMVFATGVGAELLTPMALPVLGGLLIADEVVDIFLPVRFYWIRRNRWLRLQAERATLSTPGPEAHTTIAESLPLSPPLRPTEDNRYSLLTPPAP
jgi:Cu/Ag efflux pump CusA